MEVSVLLDENQLDRIDHEIMLKNVMLSGRKPEFKLCKNRRNVRRNCTVAKEWVEVFRSKPEMETKDTGKEEMEAVEETGGKQ